MVTRSSQPAARTASQRAQRGAEEIYETLPSITVALLGKEKFKGRILEPACATGMISRVLENAGLSVESSDIMLDADCYGERGVDFLARETPVDNIVTNPPFSLASDFILRSIDLASGKIALLMPLTFLHGKERMGIWEAFPPARVWVLGIRPILQRKDAPKLTSAGFTYAWYVWDAVEDQIGPLRNGMTKLGWLMPEGGKWV